MKIDSHSHFPDDSAQNVATTFEHTKECIHWMYENNLCIKDGIDWFQPKISTLLSFFSKYQR